MGHRRDVHGEIDVFFSEMWVAHPDRAHQIDQESHR
jgi:hypothetical protein